MDNILKENIAQMVESRRDEIIGFLSKLVSIPSVTGDEATIQTFLGERLTGLGLDVRTWDLDEDELAEHPANLTGHDLI